MKKFTAFTIVFLAVCVLGILPAYAQLASANLAGTIRDDKGTPLPGVNVSAKNVDTGFERSDVTSEKGEYRIPSLPFGTYDITAQISSFSTQVKTDVRLDVGRTVSVDFSMKLSATGEKIEVKGEAPLVERTESHISTVVTPEQVQNLPLNGRQFGNLAALAPMTRLKVNSDPTRPNNLAVSLIGGSGRNYNTTIDGGDNNDDTIGGINQFFPLDSVAEFNFLTNRYKAEYGRSNGGVLNVVTKSGTNDMHGSFFYALRDDSLNALTTTEKNAGFTDPSPYNRKQYGGSFGGPIVKDKAHFFVSVDRAQVEQEAVLASPFDPAPELAGTTIPLPTRETLFSGKFTSSLDPKQFLTVRYGQQKTTAPYGNYPTYAASGRGDVTNTFHSLLASHSYVISEEKLNEFVFQYADFKDHIIPTSDDPFESFGETFYLGQNQQAPQTTQQKKYQFKDDFSWSWRGNHHFKSGINFVHEPTLGGTFTIGTTGQFFYLGTTRDSHISEIRIFGGDSTQNTAGNSTGVYFQDDWNYNEHLTLNLGIRYDYVTGFDVSQAISPLYHALTLLPYDFPWLGPVKDSPTGKLRNDKNNWQPRAGFAYDWNADGITVIRGGWGRYYDFPYANANILFLKQSLVGYGVTYDNSNTSGVTNADGTFYTINQFDGTVASLPQVGCSPCGGPLTSGPSPDEAVSPDFVVPYSNQLSIGVSHQINPDSAVDVDYVHVNFRDQYIRFRINGTVNGQRILPDFGNVRFWSNQGFSDYDGVSVSYRHRLSKKFQMQASYTLSKIEGDTLNGSDEFRLGDTRNLGCKDCMLDFKNTPKDDPRQKGPLDTDARHTFILSGIVDLPADFRVSGFLRANSARPFNAFFKVDPGTGFTYSTPDPHVNSRRATGFSQVDIHVSKTFRIKDVLRVEGILEVFNLFNAENPDPTHTVGRLDKPTFGTQTAFAGDGGNGEQRLAQLGFRIEF